MIDARNVKCVVFDGDGVIFDTFATHWKFKLELLGRDSVSEEEDEAFRKTWGKIGRLVNEFIFARSPLSEKERKRVLKKWRMKERREGVKMMPLADRVLVRLKMMGLKTVLCTNRAAGRHFAVAVKKSRLDVSLFDCVSTFVDSDWNRWKFNLGFLKIHPRHFATPFPKPDVRSFGSVEKWLEESGIGKNEVIYVGDSLVDFELAAAAGLRFVGVLTGAVNSPEKWRKWCGLDYPNIVPSIGDLPERLKIF